MSMTYLLLGVTASHDAGVTASLAAKRKSMSKWWQSSDRLTCKEEKLSLRALLLPNAFLWGESLWDDFCTFWGLGWVCKSFLVAPGWEFGPRPKSALQPGLRELNPAQLLLWFGVRKLGAKNIAVEVAAHLKTLRWQHQRCLCLYLEISKQNLSLGFHRFLKFP